MANRPADPSVAQQIELTIRELDSLSTLPCVATRFLSEIAQAQASLSALAEIIESDPALTVKILSLMYEQGMRFSEEGFSVRRAVEKLPAHLLQDTIFSIKVAGDLENNTTPSRKDLILHSLAVACCAKAIAEAISAKMNPEMAYTAGLLHNIGNLALHQAMPKSFERIVEEAKSKNASICTIEREHLGTDYTILGKRLAQEWHLPSEIALAVWLHRTDTAAIVENMPDTKIAQVIRSADSIVRQRHIGESGSYDEPDPIERIAESLGTAREQLEQIRQELPEEVGHKSEVLGLNLLRPEAAYREALGRAAARLSRDAGKLSAENRRLQTASSHFDFVKEFLLSIESNSAPLDIAENFAVGWQKFYQTGMVCLYLAPQIGSQTLEAVVVETLAQARNVILNAPAESPVIPKAIANEFAILDARGHLDWLFEQLDVDFELSQTKLLPLISNNKAVGVIAFELRYPGDTELYKEQFQAVTSTAGSVFDLAFASAERQRFAEQFAQLLSRPKESGQRPAVEAPKKEQGQAPGENDPLNALAEMTAGAAHELNNPLSVISGRAQLLAGAETDPEKKRILGQIQKNADEVSAILNDVMAFAKPEQPQPTQTDVGQMLDEAVQLTYVKTRAEHVDAQIEPAENVGKVYVDSGQIVSALANVISNSIESYPDKMGPVRITADTDESGSFVKLQITDTGCGMDAETVRKATWPFFSSPPAGRKRGMGLAHTARLIKLNKGSLDITSEPGKGTTVTICLPSKQ